VGKSETGTQQKEDGMAYRKGGRPPFFQRILNRISRLLILSHDLRWSAQHTGKHWLLTTA
jgi:hypothetical protein